MTIKLIDTHTHFDAPEFYPNRIELMIKAHDCGVRDLVMVGVVAKYFERMVATKKSDATI